MLRKFIYTIAALMILAMIGKESALEAHAANSEINFGNSYTGELTKENKENCYKFTLTESGRVRIVVTTTMGGTYYYLHNSSDVKVWGGYYRNGVDESVDLVAGTYYFYVICSSDTGNYSLKLSFDPANESFKESVGNKLDSMSDAPTIAFGESYRGQLAKNDEKDCYQFTLAESGRLRINVTTTLGGTYYYIHNSSDVKVWGGYYRNGVDELVDLVAGTYYFYVICSSDTGNYSLKLSFDPANESFKESVGNKPNSMSDAPTIAFGESYRGQLAKNDEKDCYQFTLAESGRLRINVTTTLGGTYYYIHNSSDVKVWGGYYRNGVDESVDLVAGTYYFYVICSSDTGNYSLKLSFDPANESFKESVGNKPNSMSDAPTIAFGESYRGQLAKNDEKDCYQFTLAESGRLRINVTTTLGGTYYYIHNSSDVKVWGGYYRNGVDESVDLVAGTYYFYVICSSDTGNYSFTISDNKSGQGTSSGNQGTSTGVHTCTGEWFTVQSPICTEDGKKYFLCSVCGKILEVQTIPAPGHSYSSWQISIEASCDAEGQQLAYCTLCGDYRTESVPKAAHVFTDWKMIKAATCAQKGSEERVCSVCGKKESREIPADANHVYETKVTPATMEKNGSSAKFCTICGDEQESTVIYAVKTITLASCVYNGKVQEPSVTVKDIKGKTLKVNVDYTVSCPKDAKNVGRYTATIKFKGNYEGEEKRTFDITQEETTISKLTAEKQGFTVSWKKRISQIAGYEIAYSTDSKFGKGNTKTVTAGTSSTSKTVSGLPDEKKYYVRIRAYKTVRVGEKSVKVYFAWSKVKTVVTQK